MAGFVFSLLWLGDVESDSFQYPISNKEFPIIKGGKKNLFMALGQRRPLSDLPVTPCIGLIRIINIRTKRNKRTEFLNDFIPFDLLLVNKI